VLTPHGTVVVVAEIVVVVGRRPPWLQVLAREVAHLLFVFAAAAAVQPCPAPGPRRAVRAVRAVLVLGFGRIVALYHRAFYLYQIYL
jgi:hypothetical protein